MHNECLVHTGSMLKKKRCGKKWDVNAAVVDSVTYDVTLCILNFNYFASGRTSLCCSLSLASVDRRVKFSDYTGWTYDGGLLNSRRDQRGNFSDR